jgi:KUP system potassium uptake protein
MAAVPLVALFVLVDGSFVAAGLPKFVDGGWLPIAVSVVLSTIAMTWLEGRRRIAAALATQQTPIAAAKNLSLGAGEFKGTMAFLTHDPDSVPFLARHPWIRARACEERLIVLHVASERRPYVSAKERVEIDRLSPTLVRVLARFGYMEPLRIKSVVESCESLGLQFDDDNTPFFFAEPKIEARQTGGMAQWQRWLFGVLQRNARTLPDELEIPAERRMEIGVTVAV